MAATCFVQPLDLVKNRMQMQVKTGQVLPLTTVVANIVKKEGVLAFYNGISAGLVRQATYTTTRMGVYTSLFEAATHDGVPPNFLMKTTIGMVAGITGAFVGTPADVALVRMTSDGRLPPDQRKNYANVFEAWVRIAREEGVTVLWRGAVATMGRAMVVNAAQLGTYSQTKEMLKSKYKFEENLKLHFSASMLSGLITTLASMPVDIVKTRLQNMIVINGEPEYKGSMDCVAQLLKNEGVLAFWKGFWPYYFRLGPHTVLVLIFLEKFTEMYKTYVVKE